ncbi:unnamed protein product, partial [marine sediment metagenome]
GIVKSPFGYHLIKLTGIKQAYTEPFEKVKSRINKLLIEQKSDDLAKKEAEGMRERIKEKKITFTDYVKKHPFRYNSTPFFSSTEKVEGVGWTPQFNQVAFSLKPGEISSVVQIPQGYSILKLVERKTSRIPPLKEITQKIKEKVVQEKAKRTAEEKAKQIQKEIKEGENLSSLVKKFGLEYKSLEYLKRGDWIDLGTSSTLIYAKGKGIVLNMPSILAVGRKDGRIVGVGKKAKEMLGKTPQNIVVVRPLQNGVVADYDATQRMVEYFISQIQPYHRLVGPKMVVGVPSRATKVEKKALVDIATHLGARQVQLVHEPV